MKRIRGRRVVLLIASALPLLAEDEIAPLGVNNRTQQPLQPPQNTHAIEPSPTSSRRRGYENEDHDDDENDVSERVLRPLITDRTRSERETPQTPTAATSSASFPDADTVRWGSLDSLFSNDSILPFFPLDQEFEFAPFRGASRQPLHLSGVVPNRIENSSRRKQQTADYREDGSGGNTLTWSDGDSASPQPKSPSSADGLEGIVDTIVIQSKTADASSVTAQKGSDEDGNAVKHVAVDFASKSAGAMILDSSANFKGSSNLLQTDRDKYAIVPCEEASKYVVIGLSEDILVKQIVIANYERYSSHMKEIRILGSATTAVGSNHWVDLGTYTTAIGGSNSQTFSLTKPTWARYLKVEFLSHHGDEFYCTVSQIRVHGSTVLQGFHEQWDEEQGGNNNSKTPDEVESTDTTAKSEIQSHTPVVEAGTEAKQMAQSDVDDDDAPETKPSKKGSPSNLSEIHVEQLQAATPALDRYIVHSHFAFPGKWNFTKQMERFLLRNVSKGALALASISRSSREASSCCTTTLQMLPSLQSRGQLVVRYTRMTSSSLELEQSTARNTVAMVKISKSPSVVDRVDSLIPGLSVVEDITHRFGISLPEKLLAVGDFEKDKRDVADGSSTANVAPTIASESKTRAKPTATANAVTDVNAGGNGPESTAPPRKIASAGEATLNDDHLQATSLALAKVLQRLPSAKCLESLNFSAFKASSTKSRTGSGTSSGGGGSVANMEPVFKKLTDEIRALQASVTVHDQFAQESIACYQRVLLDLLMETESTRMTQEARLSSIERDLRLGVLAVAAQRCIATLIFGALSYLRIWLEVCFEACQNFGESAKLVLALVGAVICFVFCYVTGSRAYRWRGRRSSFTNLSSLGALDMSTRDTTLKLTR